MQQMTANLTSKANPNTGMSGGDMMAYYRQAMANAMEDEALSLIHILKNDGLNEGFGVFGIIKRFTKGNFVKN